MGNARVLMSRVWKGGKDVTKGESKGGGVKGKNSSSDR